MSIEDINNNPKLLKEWVERQKADNEKYFAEHPDSLILSFENELRKKGFCFEFSNQLLSILPKQKKDILPIAVRFYKIARKQGLFDEQNYFLSFFHFRGLKELVPLLIEDYCDNSIPELTRWRIADCLYQIKCPDYLDDYIKMVSDSKYGISRQMIILLIGSFKAEKGIPVLIESLQDEELRLQTIYALGQYKNEDFRFIFEQYAQSKHPGWRKYAREALKKLDG